MILHRFRHPLNIKQILSSLRKGSCKTSGFLPGLLITILLAATGKWIAMIPSLTVLGPLVPALLLGILWRSALPLPAVSSSGIAFSSKRILRLGIILLGLRLNLMDIVHAGLINLAIAVSCLAVALFTAYKLGRVFGVEPRLALLTACGTAICGAAAVVALAPQLKAKQQEIAISTATVALLGTLFTLLYTFLYQVLGLSPASYGMFAGATLHEVAHVVAAAAPGGTAAVDAAVIMKLTRVALLLPVSLLLSLWPNAASNAESESAENGHNKASGKTLPPIPWFLFGFLLMSGVHTLHLVSEPLAAHLVDLAYFFLAMAMAGLGLQTHVSMFRREGLRTFASAGIASILLAIVGYVLVKYL